MSVSSFETMLDQLIKGQSIEDYIRNVVKESRLVFIFLYFSSHEPAFTHVPAFAAGF